MKPTKSSSKKYPESNALEQIGLAIEDVYLKYRRPKKVLIHPDLIARGFVFVMHKDSDYYILANENDFNVAVTWLKMTQEKDLNDFLYGIPLSNVEEDVRSVFSGTFGEVYSF